MLDCAGIVTHNRVVLEAKEHNDAPDHNGTVTAFSARPRILFPSDPTVALTREVFEVSHRRTREFTPAFFQLGSPEHRELEENTSETDRDAVKALTLIRCAYTSDDPITRRSLYDSTYLLMPDYLGDARTFYAGANAKKIARSVYPGLLREYIRKARIIISRGFVPAIWCPNLSVAMFVFAAYRGIAVCLNCQKLFALDLPRSDASTGERYCTAACGQRYRQKLYRLRAKAKSKSKRKGHNR